MISETQREPAPYIDFIRTIRMQKQFRSTIKGLLTTLWSLSFCIGSSD